MEWEKKNISQNEINQLSEALKFEEITVEGKRHNTDFNREDSGIESDKYTDYNEKNEEAFSGNTIMPNFTFNQIDFCIAFTLHVKNVDSNSILIERKDVSNLAKIRFSGFDSLIYSFCVKFPLEYENIFREISAEAWDNNLIFQLELNNSEFSSYESGVDENTLTKYEIAERSTAANSTFSTDQQIEETEAFDIEVRSETANELVIEVTRKCSENRILKLTETSNDEKSEDIFDDHIASGGKRQTKKSMKKRGNKKVRSLSESFCDQLKVINEMDQLKLDSKEENLRKKTLSESSDDDRVSKSKAQNLQYKSILKNRSSVSDCNESSIDDKKFYSVSADFGICQSHDSLSDSCRKTVRFSDIIKRQLFR